jgi:hypothetical protein
MSFAYAQKIKTNKNKGDCRTLTSAKHSSYNNINNLNRHDSPDHLLYLQRTIGNMAVQRLVRSKEHNNARIGFDFSKIAIQPKLKISQPSDEYEQEADRVAEHVMIMRDSLNSDMPQSNAIDEERISRKCAACEMKQEEEDEDKKLQIISRKPSTTTDTSDLEAKDEIAKEINNLRLGDGSSLNANTKDFMESRFGYDFGRVRIHTDERAARSANSVNALAYTIGYDIVFGEGQYQPNTLDGIRLLAHELAHVAQQTTTGSPPVQRQVQRQARPPFWRIPKGGVAGRALYGHESWEGLPEILFPDTRDDFLSVHTIYFDVDQMARIRRDAVTILNESSGERRLRHKPPEWVSFFMRGRPHLGLNMSTLTHLEEEHERLRSLVLSKIPSIKKIELREFLSERIHVVLPPFMPIRSLRRTEGLAQTFYAQGGNFIRLLLQLSS